MTYLISVFLFTQNLKRSQLPPIDSGYRGEIHAIISNVSTSSQTIHKDTRVGQLVITPVVIADFVLNLGNERGTGAFGSTGE